MYNAQTVKMHQAVTHLCNLSWTQLLGYPNRSSGRRWARTSVNRSAPGLTWMYWVMFPFDIHGLMMQSRDNVSETSMTGSTFGWGVSLPPSLTWRYFWCEAH